MTTVPCPCSSGKAYAACCEPHVSGKAPAPTAEALMRARYSAYAMGAIDFIERSMAPEARADFDRAAAQKWSKESTWQGLAVVAVKGGGPGDAEGVVNFTARFAQGGKDYEHREIASFRREAGGWLFVDGKAPKPQTEVRTGPDLGRNDPCHCGSGKKLKKCHGR